MAGRASAVLRSQRSCSSGGDSLSDRQVYARDGKTWDDPDFIPTIERHLGIAPATNGQTQHRPIERPPAASAPRRVEQPVRQQQRSSVPMSAPVHREPPSMSTGRPQSFRAPLTKDELEIARASGISAEKYQENKERMLRMKASGEIQN